MKKYFRFISLLTALVMLVTIARPVNAGAATEVPKLTKSERVIWVGGSTVYDAYADDYYVLKIKNRPSQYSVEWSSSNEKIASVEPYTGKNAYKCAVYAVTPGTAIISAKLVDETTKPATIRTLKCTVTIRKNCAAVDIVPATVGEMTVGDSLTLKGIMYDESAKALTPDVDVTDIVKWYSSDTSVATVSSSGVVKAVGAGKATITCYTVQTNKGTYKKMAHATAKDTVNISVKAAEIPAMSGVAQSTLDTFIVTFAEDYSKIVTADNLKLTRGGMNVDIESIEFNETGLKATVKTKAALAASTVYTVNLTGTDATVGTALSFTSSDLKPAQIGICSDIQGNLVIAGTNSEVQIKLYDAKGVDITPLNRKSTEYATYLSRLNCEQADKEKFGMFYVSGRNIMIYEAGTSVDVIGTYTDGLGTKLTAAAKFTAVNEAMTLEYIDTMVTGSAKQGSLLDWSKASKTLSVSDYGAGYRLVAKVKKSDGTFMYSDDTGSKITFEISDSSSITSFFVTSAGTISPFKEGSEYVIVKYDGVIIGSTNIVVGAARMPVQIVTLVDGKQANTVEWSDSYNVTNPTVSVALYDNYGDIYPITATGQITATVTESNMYVNTSSLNPDGSANLTIWAWTTGEASGRSVPVVLKYNDGKNELAGAFTPIVFKPVESLPTTYKAVVSGDSDMVVGEGFDAVNGKKVVIRLTAFKGNVRYADCVLKEKSSCVNGEYYAVITHKGTTVNGIIDNGALTYPIAWIEGTTIRKADPGDYTIVVYQKDSTADKPCGGAAFVLRDSQEGARFEQILNTTNYTLKATSTGAEMMSAFNQCFKVYVGGAPAYVTAIDALAADGGMYVRSVTVSGTLNVGDKSYNVVFPLEIGRAISSSK